MLTRASRLLSGPLLDIYVGLEQRHWALHQNLLIHHSRFFDETFTVNGEHKRIKEGKLYLPDEDPEAFELLVKWLYQGRIEDVSQKPKEAKWDYAFTCQKLYILSTTVGLNELQNLAIDQFRKGCHDSALVPGPEEMIPIYRKTASHSPFRRLVSKIAARQIMDPDHQLDAGTYRDCFEASPDFAVDVINEIRAGTSGILLDDPTVGNSCNFHEHEDGASCHKSVKFKNGVKGPA
ncbi:uncharacterized protein HMPREF1541_01676 [Cyphellophora europaea CBS 101466]|uniref:BTB domain-containing protein n=1 Tax=Cyphellophora europaea (strain CBS 101466) TaxID=1220924 RepID=W2S3K4_CYPE1|nr:uncharacterized protein HMPREF1541_01676 [Cyphellophora europaea CBS 101466]ETN42519.1 hypothetical protein HMPREF1541_01676 [Cyphellophora europaea CBS 101466]